MAETLFDLYDRLDRLEELLEDMADLSVASAAEAEAEIMKLNERIDALEAEGGEASPGGGTGDGR